MTDRPLDDDLAELKDVDARIEQLLDTSGAGQDDEGPRGQARVEFDRLVEHRSRLLQRINRETPSSDDTGDRGPQGSGPRPAG